MRDKTHADFIERWADFVKKNPDRWQPILDEFIDSQYNMHDKFIERLRKTEKGREKIIKLYNIKNKRGYEKLLGI